MVRVLSLRQGAGTTPSGSGVAGLVLSRVAVGEGEGKEEKIRVTPLAGGRLEDSQLISSLAITCVYVHVLTCTYFMCVHHWTKRKEVASLDRCPFISEVDLYTIGTSETVLVLRGSTVLYAHV